MDQTFKSTRNPTSFQLPPNLLNNPDIDLYKHVSDVIDYSLDETFFSEINKLKNLYNPQSQYYDPEYVLEILGATTLSNLLSDITDKVSLSMIIGNIYNIKGTKGAFEAILKLIKLNYKRLIYTQLPNGCTDVTIIMDQSVRIDIADISALIRFAKEVFPLCLTLGGITNCIAYVNSSDYSGYGSISLGQHFLDRSFILDLSKLDESYGTTISSPDGSISVLICNPNFADMVSSKIYQSETTYGINIHSQFMYQISKFQRLDFEYTLDTQINIDYYFNSTAVGTLGNHEMYYNSYNALRDGVSQNISQFRLDRDNIDRTMFRRLDGVQAYVKRKGLDYTTVTDFSYLDPDATPEIIRYNLITQRNISTDVIMLPNFSGSSSDIKGTSSDAACILNNVVSLDTRNRFSSSESSYPASCLSNGIANSQILDRSFQLNRGPIRSTLTPDASDTRSIRSSSEMIYSTAPVAFYTSTIYFDKPAITSTSDSVNIATKRANAQSTVLSSSVLSCNTTYHRSVTATLVSTSSNIFNINGNHYLYTTNLTSTSSITGSIGIFPALEFAYANNSQYITLI